jgi:3-hydroxyacyl-[acyl-carrier-protein] dehydratase
MTSETIRYPFTLDRQAIEKILPHRGDIFACQNLEVFGPHDFIGVASWSLENELIKGHFPGLPVVPGVLLIESMSQLAGAGLLSGDPYVKSLAGNLIGVLASVRKCSFLHPVLPESSVKFEIRCRQMAPMAVQISAKAHVANIEVAELETLMVYADRDQLLAASGLSS